MQKSENTQNSELNSSFSLEIFCKHNTFPEPVSIHSSDTFYSMFLSLFVLRIFGLNPILGVFFRGLFFARGRGGGKIIPHHLCYLKLLWIILETWNLVHKYTHICIFRKYTFKYKDPLNFAYVSFIDHASRIWLLDCTKLDINKKWQWCHNVLTWHHSQFFWRCHVSFVKFSHCSKFHVNIITGSGVATIFVCKRLTRNP